MPKYEIYQMGKLPPLTVVEAEQFELNLDKNRLIFFCDNKNIAVFNWNNIAGFKEVENDRA